MRYIARGEPLDRDEAWRSLGYVLGHWQIRGYGLWAAEEKASGALVGRIGLLPARGLARPRGGRGSWRASAGAKGFATEGARAALAHAFTRARRARA